MSTLQRTLACQEGYVGTITQVQTSTCANPYAQPVFGEWIESANTCEKSSVNITNVSSPISPGSPINPINSVEPPPQPVAVTPAVTTEMSAVAVVPEVKATTSQSNTESSTETKTEAQIQAPKGKELVPGFGLVMSLELINTPIQMQQEQLTILLDYTQDIDDGFAGNQDLLIELISYGNSDNFYNISNMRWDNLRRYNDIQPCYSCD